MKKTRKVTQRVPFVNKRLSKTHEEYVLRWVYNSDMDEEAEDPNYHAETHYERKVWPKKDFRTLYDSFMEENDVFIAGFAINPHYEDITNYFEEEVDEVYTEKELVREGFWSYDGVNPIK